MGGSGDARSLLCGGEPERTQLASSGTRVTYAQSYMRQTAAPRSAGSCSRKGGCSGKAKRSLAVAKQHCDTACCAVITYLA